MAYAEQTSVSVIKSKSDIERIVSKYGASQFIFGWKATAAVVGFTMCDRQVKFLLPMPNKSDFKHTPARIKRSDAGTEKAWKQATRQRWRALFLVIKAKLEAVETGITVFEEEFMAHIVLPNGKTVSDVMLPQIETAYQTGTMPALLPHFKEK